MPDAGSFHSGHIALRCQFRGIVQPGAGEYLASYLSRCGLDRAAKSPLPEGILWSRCAFDHRRCSCVGSQGSPRGEVLPGATHQVYQSVPCSFAARGMHRCYGDSWIARPFRRSGFRKSLTARLLGVKSLNQRIVISLVSCLSSNNPNSSIAGPR